MMSLLQAAPLSGVVSRPRAATSSPVRRTNQVGGYRSTKWALEYVLALVLLVVTLPLLLLAALLVKFTSRGPVFYSQVRLGRNGRPYFIYKVRTMVDRCEERTGAVWSLPNDTRITPVGRFLRATHLDELPQLWNVLRGEMALIGPRPERPEIAAGLERAMPHFRDRLQVLPGITGLAQVQLPADTDLMSVRRKLVHDLYYIRHVGLWLDIKIYICTAFRMVKIPFAWARHILPVPDFRNMEVGSMQTEMVKS